MDNGEMRLSGMLDDADEPTEERLDALRKELLANAATNAPTWTMEVNGRKIVYNPEISVFRSRSRIPTLISRKISLPEKVRRFLSAIFN